MASTISLFAFKYLFDWEYYLRANPDLAGQGIATQAGAISHWILAGRKEGRSCGLRGIEIGGSAHNDFFLDTLNVDSVTKTDNIYKQEEIKLSGTWMPVDMAADGGSLPFKDKSFDYVLSSHVIEHFYDPIAVLLEWARVARRYLFLIVPHKDKTFDSSREVTTVDELVQRHEHHVPCTPIYAHYSVWHTAAFLELCTHIGLKVRDYLNVDDKRGNGFAVLIEV